MPNPRPTARPERDRLGSRTALISSATLASRLLGFVRDALIASVLGLGPLADAFLVAFRLPNVARRLFGEGNLTLALLPAYTQARHEQGEAEARAMARSCLVWLWVVLLPPTLLGFVYAPELVQLIAPGFAHDTGLVAQTADLVRLTLPYGLLICSVAWATGVLNGHGLFLAPALAPALLNICLIAGALLALGTGLPAPTLLALAVLLAGLAQFGAQLPFLARVGYPPGRLLMPPSRAQLLAPPVRRVGGHMLPSLLAAGGFQAVALLGTLLASFLAPGAITALYLADRLAQFPLGVVAIAAATAALPSLARDAAAGDEAAFAATARRALGLTWFLVLPAAVGLYALAGPVVETLFLRGVFTPEDAERTTQALRAYCLGVPAWCMLRPLVAMAQARGRARLPALAGLAGCLAFALAGSACVFRLPQLGVAGLALATSLAGWVNCALLFWPDQAFPRGGLRACLPPSRTGLGTLLLCLPLFLAATALARAGWSGSLVLLTIPPLAAGYLLGGRFLGLDLLRRTRREPPTP